MCDHCPTNQAPTETETETETAAPIPPEPCSECGSDTACDCYACVECEKRHNPDNTPYCDACHQNGEFRCQDSCPECAYWCESCEVTHHAEDRAYCESCANAPGRRHRFVCSDNCDRCFYCEACGESHQGDYTSQCDNCQCCTENHDCNYCENCREYTSDDVCGDCNCCEGCGCECDNSGIEFVKNPIRFHKGKPCGLMPSTRFVSVEFEISKANEGDTINRVVDTWSSSVVEDGSVSGGAEVCTAPSSGDQFIAHMRELTRAFDHDGATVDHRCGAHIHLDARDMRWRDVGKLLWLYAYLEDALFSLVPSRRREAQWCEKRADRIRHVFETGPKPSWTDTAWKSRVVAVAGGGSPDSRPAEPSPENFYCWEHLHTARFCGCKTAEYNEEMLKYHRTMARYARAKARGEIFVSSDPKRLHAVKPVKHGRPPRDGRGGIAEGRRYYALNLQSWWKHGTIEIRLHGGTTEFDKIVSWAALWTGIMDFAKKASVDEVVALAQRADRWAVLMELAPSEWREFLTERRAKFN